jgi:hypothetical protein
VAVKEDGWFAYVLVETDEPFLANAFAMAPTATISNSSTTISKACDNFPMHPDEGSKIY